ncbi:MAG: MlaD family protein, partial [Thermocrispum sp.]
SPYGPEFSTFFANYNSALQYTDEAGLHYIRLIPHVNEQSVQSPKRLDGTLGTYNNPFPEPGDGAFPGPFTGTYPHVERDPK